MRRSVGSKRGGKGMQFQELGGPLRVLLMPGTPKQSPAAVLDASVAMTVTAVVAATSHHCHVL